MPELPEVETIRRYIGPRIVGRTLLGIDIYRFKNFEGRPEDYGILAGAKIDGLYRRGKFLLFSFENGYVLLSHLRMEGKWFLVEKDYPREKHDIALFRLDGPENLLYKDVRKFGFLALRKKEDAAEVPPLSELGPEPWDADPRQFFEGLNAKKGPVKEAILDQSLLSGLGNIYADEVLFDCGINPRTRADSLTPEEAAAMISSSGRILRLGIENGGSTVHSYAFAQGKTGHMQELLRAYGREGKPCVKCGAPLRKIRIGGRGTTYCPFCQREKGKPLVYAVSGPIASGKSTVAKILEKKGYRVLSADQTVDELYKDPAFSAMLAAYLEEDILTGGLVDKAKVLAKMESEGFRKKLEDKVHGAVFDRLASEIERQSGGRVLLEIPLFAHSPYEDLTDFPIYVEAPAELRRERLAARGVDPDRYLLLNKGFPGSYLKKKASLVLDGSGSPADLEKQIDACPYL